MDQAAVVSIVASLFGPAVIGALFFFIRRFVAQQDVEHEIANKKRDETNHSLSLITGQMHEIRSDAKLVREFTLKIDGLHNDMVLIKQAQKKSWETDDDLQRSITSLQRRVDDKFEALEAKIASVALSRLA